MLLSSCCWILVSDHPISLWLFFSSINVLLSHLQEWSDCAYTKTCRKLMSSSEVGGKFFLLWIKPQCLNWKMRICFSCTWITIHITDKKKLLKISPFDSNMWRISPGEDIGLLRSLTGLLGASRDRNNWLKIDPSQQQSPRSLTYLFFHLSAMRNESEEGKNEWKLPGHKKRQFSKWKKKKAKQVALGQSLTISYQQTNA